MVENEVAQKIKENLIGAEYKVTYSENSGRIFGFDILTKDFGNGNTVQVIIRNHMVTSEVSDKTMRVIGKVSFEGIDLAKELIGPVESYFAALEGIYGRKA
jgi:hypothetical protein